ncbi:DUF1338 domain-containing protein [Endozoicomonas sp. SCSIO W0465]|uniref:DUF1338 domain-containing protein n=1 Tax=Endozoicomonas sp. SCSIO W0465 TaxID=2918516 RepID=UPI0020765A89|nr:DUF1338 domain-containing protein [Endozoicomonas sp. SCSIO W0465]USE37476.1 DUF1338 domain-containing protein [Endozoicomonas sp. SCSIO W0465]
MKLSIHELLNAMWQDYLALTPDAKPIHQLFADLNQGTVVNDHIALRTFNLDQVSLDKIAKPFLDAGYQPVDDYHFPAKKLYAKYYQHNDDTLPKVFISELKVEELNEHCREIIKALVAQVSEESVRQQGFCYSGRPWHVSQEQYQTLASESEYASWVAAHGFRPNHFTVSINHLCFNQAHSHPDMQSVNQLLLDKGYEMNTSGGLIKGSPDVLLEQSSTLAKEVPVNFTDGTLTIPGCYYEFALRYPMPNGQLYQGFVAASADKIFESTDVVPQGK